jgi:hypothetical protein
MNARFGFVFFFKGNRSQTAAVQVSVAALAPALNLFQKKKSRSSPRSSK